MTAWQKVVRIVDDFINSFKTTDGGFSARKLSAYFSVVIAGIISVRHSSSENVVELSMVWLCAAFLFLGLVTIPDLIALRTGVRKDQTPPAK